MSKADFERAAKNFECAIAENIKDNSNVMKEKAELYRGLLHLTVGLKDLVEKAEMLSVKN